MGKRDCFPSPRFWCGHGITVPTLVVLCAEQRLERWKFLNTSGRHEWKPTSFCFFSMYQFIWSRAQGRRGFIWTQHTFLAPAGRHCQHSNSQELARTRNIIWKRLVYHNMCSLKTVCHLRVFVQGLAECGLGVRQAPGRLCCWEKNGTWLIEQCVFHSAFVPHMSEQASRAVCVMGRKRGKDGESEREKAGRFLCQSQPWISLVFQT